MNFLKFTNDKLSVEVITELVTSSLCGATSVFIGTTRDNFEGKNVLTLEYEAYESMGIKSMEKLCREIRETWKDIEHIAIYHRLGTVPVKEASIIIAISSPHRQDAMKATEWCIDNVKKSVPIWKKEVYDDTAGAWKENKESSHPPKLNTFKLDMLQEVEVPIVPSHLIQIKGTSDEIEQRIQKFMEMKREEINRANIRDFCRRNDTENQLNCARIDSVLIKRKDSKGHLQVNKVLNNFIRDQNNQDYLLKYIPQNGVEERVVNMESQLNLTTKIPIIIYKRLKLLEDRLLNLEAVSPEYIQFWDKSAILQKQSKKKRIFSVDEIDNLINDLEKRKNV